MMYKVANGIMIEKSAAPWGAIAKGVGKAFGSMGRTAKHFAKGVGGQWAKGMKGVAAQPAQAANLFEGAKAAVPGVAGGVIPAMKNVASYAGKHMGGAVSGVGSAFKDVTPNLSKAIMNAGKTMAQNPMTTAGLGTLGAAGAGYMAMSGGNQPQQRYY